MKAVEKPSELFEIVQAFDTHESILEITPFGSGHIHDTFIVRSASPSSDNFILQKINQKVFPGVKGLMSNIHIVSSHLQKKIKWQADTGLQKRAVELVKKINGEHYAEISGNYWRVFKFIDDSFTLQKIESNDQAYEAGKAIGDFQYMLSDLKSKLKVTIPGFHDLEKRVVQFEKALRMDPVRRVKRVDDEIRFVDDLYGHLKPFVNLLKGRKVPLRITHNDTKLNNILFDKDGKSICMIDLDTVMPGYVFYDFGDAIRTMANEANEDEQDLRLVEFNMEVYQSFKEGYYEAAKEFLTDLEMHWLGNSPLYMTFIIGLRFFTDFLNGDIYFKAEYPEHNLDRARCQFELIRKMEYRLS